jgi:sporulation protein YlmC with PRC-barrel domain
MRSFRKEDVEGKTVIDTSGSVKGKVVDVMFDLGGTVTFLVRGSDGKDSQVKIERVTGISEHVIVRSDQNMEASSSGMGATCRFCGAPRAATERWCPSCGRSQT